MRYRLTGLDQHSHELHRILCMLEVLKIAFTKVVMVWLPRRAKVKSMIRTTTITLCQIRTHFTFTIQVCELCQSKVDSFIARFHIINFLTMYIPKLVSRINIMITLICSSQTGHLAKRHFAFQSSLGLGTQVHRAFLFYYNQLLCTRRSFGASALSS